MNDGKAMMERHIALYREWRDNWLADSEALLARIQATDIPDNEKAMVGKYVLELADQLEEDK